MNDEERQFIDAQEDRQLRGTAQQTGLRAAAEHKQRTVHNANFLEELRKADLDGGDDRKKSLEDQFPSWFSGAHAVTNRGDDWALEADLLMHNKRERAVTERRPGRLLRDRPFLLATMQGAESPGIEAYEGADIPGSKSHWREVLSSKETTTDPATSEDHRRIYGGAEVAADIMSLSRNAAGLEAVSTVKTETSVRRQQEDESTASRVGKLLE